MSAAEETVVASGQLWVDNDPRNSGTRFLLVTAVDDTHATCTSWYEHGGGQSQTTRVRRDRFKPTATGYRRATKQECERQGLGVAST